MRMWNVDPEVMCNKHLLGEHVEMHMFVSTIKRGSSLRGYIIGGLVETDRIKSRHDKLAAEMERRGMNHKTPISIDDVFVVSAGHVDSEHSRVELARRCPACRELQSLKKSG